MTRSDPKAPKAKRRKKYAKPKLSRHGDLRGVAERVVGLIPVTPIAP